MAGQSNSGTKGKGKLSARTLVTAVILLPAVALLMPSCILLVLCMVPTIVAYMVDRTREKYLAITVGLPNTCGSLPALARLWSEGQTYEVALRVAADPFTLLVAYGAAAMGWVICLTLPYFLAHYYASMTETHLRALQKRQDALIEAWGEEITGDLPSKPD